MHQGWPVVTIGSVRLVYYKFISYCCEYSNQAAAKQLPVIPSRECEEVEALANRVYPLPRAYAFLINYNINVITTIVTYNY